MTYEIIFRNGPQSTTRVGRSALPSRNVLFRRCLCTATAYGTWVLSVTYITYSGAQRIENRGAARRAINREGAHPMTGRAGFLANVRTDRQGWSEHELAHLHSAAKFVRAGRRSIRTDCGVTDEGDPWFVFCADETGEIIGHFARIGSRYIACVPFRSGALTGRILPDLIEQFLQQHKFLPQHTGAQP